LAFVEPIATIVRRFRAEWSPLACTQGADGFDGAHHGPDSTVDFDGRRRHLPAPALAPP
jgi:hypothetical protein